MPDYVALHWDHDHLCGLEAQLTREKLRIRRSFCWDWPEDLDARDDPSAAGQWIKEQLQREGVGAQQCIVTLAREEAVVRQLDLPDAPDAELPALVRLQAATKSAVPLDQILLDFLPLPRRPEAEGRDVLMATISNKLADRVRSFTAAAGLELAGIDVSSVALAELVARSEQQRGDDAQQASLVLGLRQRRVELSVVLNRHLVFTHSSRLTAETGEQDDQAVLADVSRSLVSIGKLLGGQRIGRVWTLGDQPRDTLFEKLKSRFGCDLAQLELYRDRDVSWSSLPQRPDLFAIPLGALLARTEGRLAPAVDFLNPRKEPVVQDRRKLQLGVGAAAVAAVLLLGYGLLQWRLSSLEGQVESVRHRTNELRTTVKNGQPELEAAKTIGAWDQRHIPPMDELQRLVDSLGGGGQIYLTEYGVLPAIGDALVRVDATGYAKSRFDVEQLQQELAVRNYRVHPQEINPSRRDPEYPFRFELDVEWLAQAEKPAAVAAN